MNAEQFWDKLQKKYPDLQEDDFLFAELIFSWGWKRWKDLENRINSRKG